MASSSMPAAKKTSRWKAFCSKVVTSARNFFGIRPRRAAKDEGGEIGEFEARVARLDEEFWGAAWLRADIHWEGQEKETKGGNFKWRYAEKEFSALKKRCNVELGKSCICIVTAIKKEESDDVEAKNIVAGALDLYVHYFLPGQTLPEDLIVSAKVAPNIDRSPSNSYGYITNLSVATSARRRGVATAMLQYAVSAATEQGVKKVFLRVYGDNEAAVGLYEKVGFKFVEGETSGSSSKPLMLMCFEA